MDQLTTELADKIKLHQGEENLVPLGGGTNSNTAIDHSLTLIGRVVIDRELSTTSIRNNVMRLLRPLRGADIRILAANLFLIKFNHKVDRKNGLEGYPWAIDRHALLLDEIDPSVAHTAQVINNMKIVIRAHNLPIENQTTKAATAIGLNFGTLVGMLKTSGANSSLFTRIKVMVDVSQPLKRGFFAVDGQGQKTWYRVTYERLPMFCFLCGILGHGEAHCPTRYDDDFEEPEEGFPFGNWLRASMESHMETGTSLPLQALDSRIAASTHSHMVQKRGGKSFGVGKENVQTIVQNWEGGDIGVGKENMQALGDNNSMSESNASDGGRRRVDPAKLKRKQKWATSTTENRNTRPKQIHLSLVDDTFASTAEAAAQPRRLQ